MLKVCCLFNFVVHAGEARCEVKNTILFVAFDFEEVVPECNIMSWPLKFDCGSHSFVKNITSYLRKTGGTINGAIILETMINHNSSKSMCFTL